MKSQAWSRRQWLATAGALGSPFSFAAAQHPGTLRCYPAGDIYAFRWSLLQRALSTDPAWRGVELQGVTDIQAVQGRAELLLESGEIDVACFGVSAQRLQRLTPIRFDVMRGIVGLRYLIVRKADMRRFAQLSDGKFLHTLRFGLQTHWADVPIMKANGLQVELAARADHLYDMLAAGRCDALPRGANEILLEKNSHKSLADVLDIESSRTLYFPYPIYYWVRKGNQRLAKAIESGLRELARSGDFDAHFRAYHARELAFVRESKRRILRLSSAALPQPLEEPDTSSWWPGT